jgi:hypothetical protein
MSNKEILIKLRDTFVSQDVKGAVWQLQKKPLKYGLGELYLSHIMIFARTRWMLLVLKKKYELNISEL